ncbi:MAG: hypothetical protein VST66_04370 [Nitrospirota bacterium]|nr:hypothetical protein [Nitrospirota bacterium]
MKTILKIGLLVLGLIMVALVVLSASLNSLIKTGVETMGPQILGTPVTLENVEVTLLSGGGALQGSLTGLLIKNPKGFHTDHAISLPNIHIRVDRNSVLTDTIIIDEIVIDHPSITLEGSLKGSNLSTILERVEDFARPGSTNGSGEQGTSEARTREGAKQVQINHVIVKDGQINLSFTALQGRAITLALPDIHLRDIGKESGGISFQEASAEVFEAVYSGVTKTALGSGKLVEGGIDKLTAPVKDLGKAVEEAGQEILKGLLKEF